MFKFKHLLFFFSLLLISVSCSKKVKVEGQLKNHNPLNRIEIIEASGVATLPLINIGVNPDGKFSGEFEAPKNGLYLLTYGDQQSFIYLKKGQTLNISGDGVTFPNEFTITGDAKQNNDFLKQVQKDFITYSQKLDMMGMIQKPENAFITQLKSIEKDLNTTIDKAAETTKPDSEVVDFKKAELNTTLLAILSQYELAHGQMTGNMNYKPSAQFKAYEKELDKDPEAYARLMPHYRNYMLQKLMPEFQKYAEKLPEAEKQKAPLAFKKFLDTKKDLNAELKDYLLSFIMAQEYFNVNAPDEVQQEGLKLVDSSIKNSEIKENLKKIHFVLNGPKIGSETPKMEVKDQKNAAYTSSSSDKATLVMFYSSWQPMIGQFTIPIVKEVTDYFGNKMNYLYVNMDDTHQQFLSTSKNLMKGLPGMNVWAEGGINGKTAQNFGLYSFRLPSFVIIGKDGKIASKTVANLGDPAIISVMEKVTGKKAPTAPPVEPAPAPIPENGSNK